MAFREGWFEGVKGVVKIALSLHKLGTRSVGRTTHKIGGFRMLQENWNRKRLEENAQLRADLQRIRAILLIRNTLVK